MQEYLIYTFIIPFFKTFNFVYSVCGFVELEMLSEARARLAKHTRKKKRSVKPGKKQLEEARYIFLRLKYSNLYIITKT